MYNSRTKSTRKPAPLPERPQKFPTTRQLCRKKKTGSKWFACTSLPVCPFRHFHSVFRSSTLHSNSFTTIPAISTPRKEWLIQSSYQSQTHCLVFALCFSLFRFILPCKLCRLCSLLLSGYHIKAIHTSNIHPFGAFLSLPPLTFSNAFQWSVFFFCDEFTPEIS